MKINEYLQQHYTTKTAKAYIREIEIYIANNPNNKKYVYAEIINYIGVLRKRYTNPRTLNRMLSSIKAYYSYLCFKQVRKDNPTKSIVLKDQQSRDIQLQDLFTADELDSLLTAKKERYTNLDYRNKVLISLLIYQALRPIEMEALQCDEINLQQGTIYIKPTPKNNGRTLSLKANQILLFKNYIEEIRPKLLKENQTNILIIGHRKEPMTGEDITKHIKRNYNIFKPRNVNAMTIRQSVITNLLKQNNDLRIVQAFAGHKTPSTTEKYKQNNIEALQQQINIHHPIK
jgi:integrase/recombinase XerD